VEAISAKIPKSFYFYFVSRFCSRAFTVVGNLFLDKGAGEHRRHLMIFTEGLFLAEGLFLNVFEHAQAWFYSSRADQINFQRLGDSFRRKNEEDIIFLRFSTEVENVKKRLSVETIYLLLFYFYWGRRFARSEKGATRDYYYSDYSFYVCQPWSFLAVAPIFACPQTGFHGAALVQNLGAPPGSPWVWRHSVWQAGPPKPLKAQ
jgi:hypothetical protein